jgi:hypothetical protein
MFVGTSLLCILLCDYAGRDSVNRILRGRNTAGTRLNTIDLFRNLIEHDCSQIIETKKESKNHTIEHDNGCDVAALYRIIFGAPYYCVCKIFL